MQKTNKLKAWLPVIIYCGIIFTMSSFPVQLPDAKISSFDKLVHVAEYAVLGLLIARAFKIQKLKATSFITILFAAELALLYGAIDEIHQVFVPGRFASILDLLADGAGGLLGSIVYGRYKTI